MEPGVRLVGNTIGVVESGKWTKKYRRPDDPSPFILLDALLPNSPMRDRESQMQSSF